jgi:hypothetical protein
MEQVQEVHQSGGFLASNDVRARFGLGSSTVVDELEIDWPSGLVQKFHGVKTRQTWRVKEGENELVSEPMRGARSSLSIGN